MSQDDILSKFSTENTSKNIIKNAFKTNNKINNINNKNIYVNNYNYTNTFKMDNENNHINNKNNFANIINKNENKNKRNSNYQLNQLTNNKISSLSSNSLENNGKIRKNVHFETINPFSPRSHSKLNKNKKNSSCIEFLAKIKNLNLYLKNNISLSNQNYKSCRNLNSFNNNINNERENNSSNSSSNSKNKNKRKKLSNNEENKKVFDELLCNIAKEENKIKNEVNNINNNLLDIKFKKYINSINYYQNITKTKPKKRKYKSLINKSEKNKYRKIAENLSHYKKGLYNYAQVNKYIYGSKNPLKVFGGFTIDPYKIKIKKNNYLNNKY